MRPAECHQQISVFSAIGSHRPQRGLRAPIGAVIFVRQRVADVIIKGAYLLARRVLALGKLLCQGHDLRIGRFDVQFRADKFIELMVDA